MHAEENVSNIGALRSTSFLNVISTFLPLPPSHLHDLSRWNSAGRRHSGATHSHPHSRVRLKKVARIHAVV